MESRCRPFALIYDSGTSPRGAKIRPLSFPQSSSGNPCTGARHLAPRLDAGSKIAGMTDFGCGREPALSLSKGDAPISPKRS
jgi:hypothetical protein